MPSFRVPERVLCIDFWSIQLHGFKRWQRPPRATFQLSCVLFTLVVGVPASYVLICLITSSSAPIIRRPLVPSFILHSIICRAPNEALAACYMIIGRCMRKSLHKATINRTHGRPGGAMRGICPLFWEYFTKRRPTYHNLFQQ